MAQADAQAARGVGHAAKEVAWGVSVIGGIFVAVAVVLVLFVILVVSLAMEMLVRPGVDG